MSTTILLVLAAMVFITVWKFVARLRFYIGMAFMALSLSQTGGITSWQAWLARTVLQHAGQPTVTGSLPINGHLNVSHPPGAGA